MKTYWEVDLRSRYDGKVIECMFSTENRDMAYGYLKRWYDEHPEIKMEDTGWNLVDWSNGVFAEMCETVNPMGVNKLHYKSKAGFDALIMFARNVSNFMYNDSLIATEYVMATLESIYDDLNTWEDYVKVYDDHFYTYQTWKDLLKSEEEQAEGLTEDECYGELGKTIFPLPNGWYIQYV